MVLLTCECVIFRVKFFSWVGLPRFLLNARQSALASFQQEFWVHHIGQLDLFWKRALNDHCGISELTADNRKELLSLSYSLCYLLGLLSKFPFGRSLDALGLCDTLRALILQT